MQFGRDEMKLAAKVITALERIAEANEKLIELATEERSFEDQGGPPFCPHCQTFNPKVRNRSEGDGPLSSFVLICTCTNCNGTIYAIPEGWQIAGSIEDARLLREERDNARAGGNNGNST